VFTVRASTIGKVREVGGGRAVLGDSNEECEAYDKRKVLKRGLRKIWSGGGKNGPGRDEKRASYTRGTRTSRGKGSRGSDEQVQ